MSQQLQLYSTFEAFCEAEEFIPQNKLRNEYQVVIAQWLSQRLAAGEVPGSNHGKVEFIFRKI